MKPGNLRLTSASVRCQIRRYVSKDEDTHETRSAKECVFFLQ